MEPVSQATSLADLAARIERDGFALWPIPLAANKVAQLRELCEHPQAHSATIERAEQLYARRNLLTELPDVLALAQSAEVRSVVQAVLKEPFQVVRALLFDKVPAANWHVGWHQDLMVPLAAKVEVAGFTAWSVKAGVIHAKPPTAVLEQMIILRIHLDDCQSDNGPLRLMAGSHRQGELQTQLVKQCVASGEERICLADAGAILVMRPLVLHASSAATHPHHRRVLHLEFARECLPYPLAWPEPN